MSGSSGEDPVDSSVGFVVTVPYVQNDTPVSGTYAQVLRMGGWASTNEALIVDSSGNFIMTTTNGTTTNTSYTGDDPLQDKGILIYSADQYTVYAPQIRAVGSTSTSSWANEQMTITTDGTDVVGYSYVGPLGFTASFQKLDAISITNGSTSNFIAGNAMTVWSGNDASTGLGGLLWSNFGLTQNIFDGQVVNINGPDMSVQGRFATSIAPTVSTAATRSIELAVNPISAFGNTSMTVASRMRLLTLAAGALAAGVAPVVIDNLAIHSTDNMSASESDIKASAKAEFDAAAVISVTIIAIQAIASLSGLVLTAAAGALFTADPFSKLSLGVEEAVLSIAPSALTLSPATAKLNSPTVTVASTVETTIQCAPAKIEMSPVQIVLSMGPDASITITPEGVAIVGLQNNVE